MDPLSIAALQNYLQGVDFPADKEEVASATESNGAPQEIVEKIRNVDRERFDNSSQVFQDVRGSLWGRRRDPCAGIVESNPSLRLGASSRVWSGRQDPVEVFEEMLGGGTNERTISSPGNAKDHLPRRRALHKREYRECLDRPDLQVPFSSIQV